MLDHDYYRYFSHWTWRGMMRITMHHSIYVHQCLPNCNEITTLGILEETKSNILFYNLPHIWSRDWCRVGVLILSKKMCAGKQSLVGKPYIKSCCVDFLLSQCIPHCYHPKPPPLHKPIAAACIIHLLYYQTPSSNMCGEKYMGNKTCKKQISGWQ